MVKVSYHQKPYRRSLMQVFGASVVASPSEATAAGRRMNEEHPDSPGSLGVAISEAIEDARSREDSNYALGSVLNHVLLHQTVIGLEAKEQLASVDAYPDVIVGSCGGGSNFGGIAFPFLADRFQGKSKVRAVAVEPNACPSLTRGSYAYDYGDMAHLTPMTMMYTLGHTYMPPEIHSGGLRYHGASALVSKLYHDKHIEAIAVGQNKVFEAARLFAQSEGILPAPESAHAILGAIEEALLCKESGEEKTILFCLSGHGHFDLSAYDSYLAGSMTDAVPSEAELTEGIGRIGQ
jgi:tryptophan synthase beta chain